MTATTSGARRARLTAIAFATLPYVTLLGCAGLVAMALLGFEEPDPGLLLLSSVLVAAAPVGFALHLATSRELDGSGKRAWAAELARLKSPGLFAAYFDPASRAQATRRLLAGEHGAENDPR